MFNKCNCPYVSQGMCRIGRMLQSDNYPGTPPDSMWLANVTSSLHTSNCHLRKPRTPHSTLPVCIPILMSTLNPVASRTNLQQTMNHYFVATLKSLLSHLNWSNCFFDYYLCFITDYAIIYAIITYTFCTDMSFMRNTIKVKKCYISLNV